MEKKNKVLSKKRNNEEMNTKKGLTKEEVENFDALSFQEYYEQVWIQEILEDLDEEEKNHLMEALKRYLSMSKRKKKDVEHFVYSFIKNMFD